VSNPNLTFAPTKTALRIGGIFMIAIGLGFLIIPIILLILWKKERKYEDPNERKRLYRI
jgi:hypothetical protein